MASWKHKLWEHFAPLLLILLVILTPMLNSALIIGVQVAAGYPHRDSHTAPFPDNYEILDTYGYYQVNGDILWMDDQQWHLLITEKHFKADRWRTVCDITLTEQNYSGDFPVQTGRVSVQLEGYDDFAAFNWTPSLSYRVLKLPTDFLLWSGGLLLLEAAAVISIRKLRGN